MADAARIARAQGQDFDLHTQMRGQDHVVARSSDTQSWRVGPDPSDRPRALLTVGLTGTGKTELVFLTVRYPGTLFPCELRLAAICS